MRNSRAFRFVIAAVCFAFLLIPSVPTPIQAQIVPSPFVGLSPARVLDSRGLGLTVDGLSSGGGVVGAGSVTVLTVVGRGGVPVSGVGAVVLNVAVTGSSVGGWLTVFPSGVSRPVAANVNFGAGETVSNAVVATVGVNGTVSIYASAGTHLIVDVQGWFPGTPVDPSPVDCATGVANREPATGMMTNNLIVVVNPCSAVIRIGEPSEFAVRVRNNTGSTIPGPISLWFPYGPDPTFIGSDWNCVAKTCTRTQGIAAGAEPPAVRMRTTFTGNPGVAASVYVQATTGSSVIGRGRFDTTAVPTWSASLVPSLEFRDFAPATGKPGTNLIRVQNLGELSHTGPTTVLIDAGATFVSGVGWTCVAGQCSNPQPVPVGGFLPMLTVANGGSSVAVQAGGQVRWEGIQSVQPAAALTPTVRATGRTSTSAFYNVVVTNLGDIAHNGLVSITLGSSSSFTASGSGWFCNGTTCTLPSSTLAVDATTPAINVVVNLPTPTSPSSLDASATNSTGAAIGGSQENRPNGFFVRVVDLTNPTRAVGPLREARITVGPGVGSLTTVYASVGTSTPLPSSGWVCPGGVISCSITGSFSAGSVLPPLRFQPDFLRDWVMVNDESLTVSGDALLSGPDRLAELPTTMSVSTLNGGGAGDPVTVKIDVGGNRVTSKAGPIRVWLYDNAGYFGVLSSSGSSWACNLSFCEYPNSLGPNEQLPPITMTMRLPQPVNENATMTFLGSSGPEQLPLRGGSLVWPMGKSQTEGIVVVRDVPRSYGDPFRSKILVEPGRIKDGNIVVKLIVPQVANAELVGAGFGVGWQCSVTTQSEQTCQHAVTPGPVDPLYATSKIVGPAVNSLADGTVTASWSASGNDIAGNSATNQ
jgi:hypothetical protein